jgi:hypothetical protein
MSAPAPGAPGSPTDPATEDPRSATPATPRWGVALSWTSLVIGIVIVLTSLNLFFADPIGLLLRAVVGGIALAAAIVALVRYRRAGRSAPPVGIAGLVVSIVSLVIVGLGVLQFAVIYAFAERLEEPPAVVSSSQAAAEQAATEREFAEAARASSDMLEVVRLPDGTYPTRLAVTTDDRQLISPNGVVIADLPFGTSVHYEVYVDATQYRLLLFGPNGTRAEVDSEDGITVEHVDTATW